MIWQCIPHNSTIGPILWVMPLLKLKVVAAVLMGLLSLVKDFRAALIAGVTAKPHEHPLKIRKINKSL